MKNLCNENSDERNHQGHKKLNDIPNSWVGRIHITKISILAKAPTDAMQSPSK